ncbi:YkgJ family cysteine cluster protein [Helicobacter anatolicus]|uniref:YkgJ family cysteine cluster protein n=1 Tax=Helicobacter anatolicus TaxID=2905874 RepID=UPI001E54621A|nr:YkgJ family cysteine cluster protein [Helicobacter anatolicus]MCE3039654.1 YkgJ family cysteine cluster protein [Helicobacter anatolicus]
MSDFKYSFDGSACASCGGKCCTGESGYIFCSIAELQKICEFLKISFNEFTQKYVKKVGYNFSLIEKRYLDGYACIFFDTETKKCGIYDVRPNQCKTFPFWDIYKNEENFQELLQQCIGIKVDKKYS